MADLYNFTEWLIQLGVLDQIDDSSINRATSITTNVSRATCRKELSLSSNEDLDNIGDLETEEERRSLLLGLLFVGISNQNILMVTKAIDEGCELQESILGLTPLTLCILFADRHNIAAMKDIICAVLDSGALIDQRETRTPYRWTPLHLACKRGLASIVDILINRGASLNMSDYESGKTPLQISLELLGEPTYEDDSYRAVLKQAISLLSASGIDVTLPKNRSSKSILELAVLTSELKLISTVINRGHMNFNQLTVREAIDALSRYGGPKSEVTYILRLLQLEILPERLENLCLSAVSNDLSSRRLSASMLPCPIRVKHLIRDQLYRPAKSGYSKDKEMAFQFLFQL